MKRIDILNKIFSNFQQITQWIPNNFSSASKYMFRSECLIEILEVEDCGSTGGFDFNSPVILETNFHLYDRFLAVLKKYNKKEDIEEVCNFNVDDIQKYFIQVSKLRDNLKK